MDYWAKHTIASFLKGKGIDGITVGEGKKDYLVAIPSYDRVETLKTKTIALLERNKIPKDIVYIFVANEEEAKKYREAIPGYRFIIAPVKGILNTRNFITNYFKEGQKLVHFDDDIEEVLEKVSKDKLGRIMKKVDLQKFIPMAFSEIDKRGLSVWGVNPVNNPYMMAHNISTDLRYVVGAFRGVINRREIQLKFSNQKEDVENTIRLFIRDGGVLRYNYITVKTKWYAPGGIVSQTSKGDADARKKLSKEAVDLLIKAFPEYGRIKQRSNGIYEFELIKRPILKGGKVPPQRVRDEDFTNTSIYTPSIRNPAKVEKAKVDLLEVLRRSTIPPIPKPVTASNTNRGNKLGTKGKTLTLGFGDTRHGIKQFKLNKKYPELLRALITFGNAIVPKGFEYNAITVNEGVKAKKHIDSKNGGVSYIIGIGDFRGGDIRVWDKDGKNPKEYDLNGKPVGFNGGLLFHQTADFVGERYTIIYYKQLWEGGITGYKTVGTGKVSEELEQPSYEEIIDDGAIFA